MHDGWLETEAKVTGCKVSRSYRNLGGYSTVSFTYVVNGVKYEGGLVCGDEMLEGETFPIHYDPNHPERNDAEMGNGNWAQWYTWLLTAVGLVLFVYFWLKR